MGQGNCVGYESVCALHGGGDAVWNWWCSAATIGLGRDVQILRVILMAASRFVVIRHFGVCFHLLPSAVCLPACMQYPWRVTMQVSEREREACVTAAVVQGERSFRLLLLPCARTLRFPPPPPARSRGARNRWLIYYTLCEPTRAHQQQQQREESGEKTSVDAIHLCFQSAVVSLPYWWADDGLFLLLLLLYSGGSVSLHY